MSAKSGTLGIPGDERCPENVGGELTEGDTEVAEGTACYRHVDGELCVAEGG